MVAGCAQGAKNAMSDSELGYVSSRSDLKELMSQNWRAHAGDAIVQAVDAYFSTRLAGGSAH